TPVGATSPLMTFEVETIGILAIELLRQPARGTLLRVRAVERMRVHVRAHVADDSRTQIEAPWRETTAKRRRHIGPLHPLRELLRLRDHRIVRHRERVEPHP